MNRDTYANVFGKVAAATSEPASAPGIVMTHSRGQAAARIRTLHSREHGMGQDGTFDVGEGELCAKDPASVVGEHLRLHVFESFPNAS